MAAANQQVTPCPQDGLLIAAGLALKICKDEGAVNGVTFETVVQTLRAQDPEMLTKYYSASSVSPPACNRSRPHALNLFCCVHSCKPSTKKFSES